jgi:xanthine dehydrogenase accessory factor
MSRDAWARAEELRASGEAFVLATVVRVQRPTSAKPGAHALIRADGTMIGFVGGDCAQASVRVQALATLRSGDCVLLRIVPDDESGADPHVVDDGVVTVQNPCLSGGTLEVFLEPTIPAPRMIVHGESPIAVALTDLARHLGYTVDASPATAAPSPAVAMVVASHGDDEAKPLEAAVRAGVPYVGLVASRRRGPQVLESLDLTEEAKEHIHTPAGIDIKARTPAEVAVSIMAEIIASKRGDGEPSGHGSARAWAAVDPVCGMTVVASDPSARADIDGVRLWFCGSGCRDAFVAEPASFPRR